MPNYVVNDNAQNNGDHEVHKTSCIWFPKIKSYTSLGSHDSCASAVKEAKKVYPQSNGCETCSKPCHTT